MFMSHAVLGGVSARYNIDALSLLRFYTNCGHKYAKDVSDLEMAHLCFTKAADFIAAVEEGAGLHTNDTMLVSRAMFDLLLGRAECAWEREDNVQAERFVTDARKFLQDLPGEYEFLASVEYNFGLFTYQQKNTERALQWLQRSIETRGNPENATMHETKQACTMRLAGVCLLALQKYEQSWEMMKEAEELSHDPSGAYLRLKLSVITKQPNALDLLINTVTDDTSSLEVCTGSIALFSDAQRLMDAATGYRQLVERFKTDAKAMVCVIGPRFFETLAALGKLTEALDVLETCCALISKLSTSVDTAAPDDLDAGNPQNLENIQFSRWAAMCMAAGCEHSDRSDFPSAAILLNRALKVAKLCTGSPDVGNADVITPNIVLESEAMLSRLASTCALCSLEDISQASLLKSNNTDTDREAAQANRKEEMLNLAIGHAKRAKELDRADFTPRLLLFRAYLLGEEFSKAALELQKASGEIRTFDAGALAEAACAARDVGSTESVIAALKCVLKLDDSTLQRTMERGNADLPQGFYGAVFTACVRIFRANMTEDSQRGDEIESTSSEGRDDKTADLADILKAGAHGLKVIGMERAFDTERQAGGEDAITYLMNVAWNEGRKAGKNLHYGNWEAFFETCYELSVQKRGTMETVQMRRMCKLMSACANVERPQASRADFESAKQQIQQARDESKLLEEMAPTGNDDPIEGVLLALEARCNVGIGDLAGLHAVIANALKTDISGGTLEQLAAITNSWQGCGENQSEERVQCTDMTVALLSKAMDVRLRAKHVDVTDLSMTMRELITLELSRKNCSGRAYVAFRKAVDVVLERAADFPEQERRWLVAVGWDRGQMFLQIGRRLEAKRWIGLSVRLVDRCAGLSSYKPRLEACLLLLADVPDDQ